MNFWQKTKRFFEPIAELRGNFFWHIIIHVLYNIGKIVPLLLLIVLQNNKYYSIDILIWALTYVVVGFMLISILRRYYWIKPMYTYYRVLVQEYIEKFLLKDNLAHEAQGTGRSIAFIDRGINTWSLWLADITKFIINILFVGTFIVMRLFLIKWEYGVAGLIGILLTLIWIIWNNKRGLVARTHLKESESIYTKMLVRIFMSKFEVLQNRKIQHEIKNLQDNLDDQYVHSNIRNQSIAMMYDVPFFVLLFLMVIILLINNTYFTNTNPALMVEFIGATILIQSVVFTYIDFIKDFSKEFVHIEKLWDFMDNTPDIEGYDTWKPFHFQQGNYTLKNIGFTYGTSAPVFHDFSLEIKGGQRTALVWHSGGGKTTLMKLLAGYMRPTSWELLIDHQDIASIRLDSYYPHIGYLTQEPSVFDGTIRENLLYGTKKTPTKKHIEEAIEMAECQFIHELEHDLDTEIGERWIRLSGWQKQRLAIAKIFLKDPEIILLDEPTAALDSYSEQKVAQAFERLFQGRTVIVIAHRLQTVKSADDIIVIEKWHIVERWTHRQLLKLWKKYAGMVDLQSGLVREEEETPDERDKGKEEG